MNNAPNPKRNQIVALLRRGRTNAQIADAAGVSVNVVAGIRARTIGSTMTQQEALALPKPGIGRLAMRRRRGREAEVVKAVKEGAAQAPSVAERVGINANYASTVIRRLVARGIIRRTGYGRWTHYAPGNAP